MHRLTICLVLALTAGLAAQQPADPVAQALAQGDQYQARKKYELALDAYHKADKLSHHTSATAYLRIASVESKLGDLPWALDDSKRAVKAAGADKALAVEAHLMRATLLTQMAAKATDKKLKEAEEDLRQALALDSGNALAHYNLGMVLLKQERDAEGIAELKTFVASPGAKPQSVVEAQRLIANPIRAREPFAPDFAFTADNQQRISNASLRGSVVLLDFWGTWCPPCRESVPMLRDLKKKYRDKPLRMVGISSDDDQEVWRTFIQAQHMDWPDYLDADGSVQEAFKIQSFPTFIVLDRDGVVRFRQAGLDNFTGGYLEDAINKALKRPSDPALVAAAAAEAPAAPAGAAAPAHAPSASASAATAPLAGIEAWSIAENLYRNPALGLSYEFPKGWVAATPEALHTVNERVHAAALAALQQHDPELAKKVPYTPPSILLYISRKAAGDGERLALPCLRITAQPIRLQSVSMELFQRATDSMVALGGAKVVTPAAEFTVQQHKFLRLDLERAAGSQRAYESYVQTVANGYLLTIEIYAASQEELQQIAGSLQSMSITEAGR